MTTLGLFVNEVVSIGDVVHKPTITVTEICTQFFRKHGSLYIPLYWSLESSQACLLYVVVIPCLPGVYTIYTRYCVNKPEGVARGFISTIPSVNGIHTRWAWNR